MKTTQSFQSSVASEIVRYISLKKALKRQFESAARILLNLDRFLCQMGNPSRDLTSETFKHWCKSMESLSTNTRHGRMRVVRNFCLYRRRTAPACFVPDRAQFPLTHPTIQPHLFSDTQVASLLDYCAIIPNSVRSPLRGAATRLAIVLLFTTGLRRGELLRLTAQDYDPSHQTILIRTSKFYKSRLLPLPNDVAAEIEQFLKAHKAIRPPLATDAPILWNPYCGGRAYSSTQLRKNLQILFKLAGIKKPNGRLPRIHDFRFSFAVSALLRWYRDGADVQAKLPFLAAYMGHFSVVSTYYYLRFTEPLASLASAAFAAHYGALIQAAERRACDES
jgi:integrase